MGQVQRVYQRLLGHPFVYERIRPLVVGGIDMQHAYDRLGSDATRVVLDVGCGTGDALRHLCGCERYLGLDTDAVAIDAARTRFGTRPSVEFAVRSLRIDDVLQFAPTGVVLIGLLHHLDDAEAEGVLRLAGGSPQLVRIVTLDIVYLPGKHFNNLLCRLDRGRHCRVPAAYGDLARRAGLTVETESTVPASAANRRVFYQVMTLTRSRAQSS